MLLSDVCLTSVCRVLRA